MSENDLKRDEQRRKGNGEEKKAYRLLRNEREEQMNQIKRVLIKQIPVKTLRRNVLRQGGAIIPEASLWKTRQTQNKNNLQAQQRQNVGTCDNHLTVLSAGLVFQMPVKLL